MPTLDGNLTPKRQQPKEIQSNDFRLPILKTIKGMRRRLNTEILSISIKRISYRKVQLQC